MTAFDQRGTSLAGASVSGRHCQNVSGVGLELNRRRRLHEDGRRRCLTEISFQSVLFSEDGTKARFDLVRPVRKLGVLIDVEAHAFEERSVVRYWVLPDRQPGNAARVKFKRHERESTARTENPDDLE